MSLAVAPSWVSSAPLAPMPATTQGLRLAAAQAAEQRGGGAYDAGDAVTALAELQEAQRLGLDHGRLHVALGTAHMHLGHRTAAIREYRLAIRAGTWNARLLANLIFLLDHEPGTTLETALEARKGWWQAIGAPLRPTWRPHGNTIDPARPLRIGYVSGDFRRHSAAQAFGLVVLRHSEGYQAVCYSTAPAEAEDEYTGVFATEAAEFHRVSTLSPTELAARIRADRIDILVDLSGYSARQRLETFCQRPAPVQVTGWGYATGTGLPVMDGFFADPITVPPALAGRGYVEPILYLPSIIPFTDVDYSEGVGPLPCLARGEFTFGSFNRWMKLSPAALAAWGQILARVPDSRLLLKEKVYEQPEIRAQVLGAMATQGVEAGRIEFRGHTDHRDHLHAYHEVDLALDPFPHTGGVTALEGLWQGVPPLTLIGERVPERLSASFCTTLALHSFIAESVEEYVELAVAMASDYRPQLAMIRATLQHRIAASPLCVGYTRAVESHYRDLWQSWCRRQAA